MQAEDHSGARMLEVVTEVAESAGKNSNHAAASTENSAQIDLNVLGILAADNFDVDGALERLISRACGN
jgi:hypothetical protein